MITNLFSVFDPRTSLFSTSWLIIPIAILILSTPIWKISYPFIKTKKLIVKTFKKEVKFSLGKTEKRREILIILAFITILSLNFIALYPQVFSPTSHITITLPLSLIYWIRIVSFGWAKNTNHMLSHLLPQGTPNALIIFIVLIELTSNIIRPITLCVRLTANLIAGHLLISLLGNSLMSIPTIYVIPALAIPILLTVLESAVACIQAYVFITLITLYTAETK